jgi:hypothetical protein
MQIPRFKNHEADYFEFYKLWSSSAFKLVLEKKRLNHGKDLVHRYGVDGHVRKAKCMVRGHVLLSNLSDPSNPDELYSQSAMDRLVRC